MTYLHLHVAAPVTIGESVMYEGHSPVQILIESRAMSPLAPGPRIASKVS